MPELKILKLHSTPYHWVLTGGEWSWNTESPSHTALAQPPEQLERNTYNTNTANKQTAQTGDRDLLTTIKQHCMKINRTFKYYKWDAEESCKISTAGNASLFKMKKIIISSNLLNLAQRDTEHFFTCNGKQNLKPTNSITLFFVMQKLQHNLKRGCVCDPVDGCEVWSQEINNALSLLYPDKSAEVRVALLIPCFQKIVL